MTLQRTVNELLFVLSRKALMDCGVDGEAVEAFRRGDMSMLSEVMVQSGAVEPSEADEAAIFVLQVHRKVRELTLPQNLHPFHDLKKNPVAQLGVSFFCELQLLMDGIFARGFVQNEAAGRRHKFLRLRPIKDAFDHILESAGTTPFVGYGVRQDRTAKEPGTTNITIMDIVNVLCMCDGMLVDRFYSLRARDVRVAHRLQGLQPNRLLRLQEFFTVMDKDGSGTVTKDELTQYIRQDPKMAALMDLGSTRPSKEELDELFAKLDASGDDAEQQFQQQQPPSTPFAGADDTQIRKLDFDSAGGQSKGQAGDQAGGEIAWMEAAITAARRVAEATEKSEKEASDLADSLRASEMMMDDPSLTLEGATIKAAAERKAAASEQPSADAVKAEAARQRREDFAMAKQLYPEMTMKEGVAKVKASRIQAKIDAEDHAAVQRLLEQDPTLDMDAAKSVVQRMREAKDAGRDPFADFAPPPIAPATPATPATPGAPGAGPGVAAPSTAPSPSRAKGDGVIDFIEFCAFFRSMPAIQFWSVIETPGRADKAAPKSPRPWAAAAS